MCLPEGSNSNLVCCIKVVAKIQTIFSPKKASVASVLVVVWFNSTESNRKRKDCAYRYLLSMRVPSSESGLSAPSWALLSFTEMQTEHLGSTCLHQAATHACIRKGIFQEETTHWIWHFQIELEAALFPGLASSSISPKFSSYSSNNSSSSNTGRWTLMTVFVIWLKRSVVLSLLPPNSDFHKVIYS